MTPMVDAENLSLSYGSYGWQRQRDQWESLPSQRGGVIEIALGVCALEAPSSPPALCYLGSLRLWLQYSVSSLEK